MTLRELISYLMEIGQGLSVSSQRQWDEVGVLFVNIYELQFLDITLFQYFMIFMVIVSSVWSALVEAEINEILSPFWSVIFLLFNVLIFIWYIYFAWLSLKFVLGWLVYFSS